MSCTLTRIVGRVVLVWMVALGLSLSGAQVARAGGFVKFDGVDGESTDKNHEGWSDLVAFSQNLTQERRIPQTLRHRNRAATIAKEFILQKTVDRSSPNLSQAICGGTHFRTVMIDICTEPSDGSEIRDCYLRYELKNVRVSSYSISANGDTPEQTDRPVEEIALNYTEVKMVYFPDDPSDGPVEGEVSRDSCNAR